MEKRDNDSKKVTKGDVEFVSYMSSLEDEKETESSNFIIPPHIFKIYIETTTKEDYYEEAMDLEGEDELEDQAKEVQYNVYGVVESMYFLIGTFEDRQIAERFAEVNSIRIEKQLKKNLVNSFMYGLNGGKYE